MSLSIAMSDVSNRETKTHPSLQAGGVVIKRISPNHIERVVELTTRRIGDAMKALLHQAQESYPDKPSADDDRWWLPVRLGGTAPTPDEARELDKKQGHLG